MRHFAFKLFSAALTLLPTVVFAADPKKADPIDLSQYSPFPEGTSIRSLILSTIPNFLIAFVGFTFLVYFLINAFRYLISSGNSEGTTAAKSGMLSAIIGIIVSLTAFGVVNVAARWIGN